LSLFCGQALACPICFSGRVVSIGQKIDAADAAVLAQPGAPGGGYKVVEVIKGSAKDLASVITDVTAPPVAPTASSEPLQLLLRNRLSGGWTSLGAIAARQGEWLRELAALGAIGEPAVRLVKPHGAARPDAGWIRRLRLVAPFLESSDPLAAEIAYGEVARAPYHELRKIKSVVDPAAIAGWIADPALATRRPAYTLLLGITGTPAASDIVERSLEAAYRSHDASNLSALLAADLELHGASRLPWIEQSYFTDRKRTLPEIEAALLALSVQGAANAAVARSDVIAAYARFIDLRRPMAGFVVGDLIAWEYWDASGKLIEVLKSGAIKDPGSRLAVINYLRRSPIPIASAEIEQLSDLPP
jgi:hypothetical protein